MSLLATKVRLRAEQLVMVINPQKKKSMEKVICAVEQLTTYVYHVKSGEKLYSAGFPFFFVYLKLFILFFFNFKRPHWLRHLKYKMVIKSV